MLQKVNKTYHVLVYTVLTTNANNVNSSLCFFDWGQLPRSRWKVKMYGYVGNCSFTSNQVIQVFADFNQNKNELVRNSSGALPTANKDYKTYLGTVINFTNRGNNCTFYSKADDNGATYLDSTPANNIFNLYLYNHGGGQGLFTPNSNGNTALFGFAFEMLDDPIYRTVRNTYNIILNSENGTKIGNATGYNSLGAMNYYFDWDLLKKGEYLVYTSLVTSDDPLYATAYNGSTNSVYIDFGQGNKTVFNVKSSSGGNMNRNVNYFLAIAPYIRPNSYFPIISYRDSTPPIFLTERPTNNTISVYLLNGYLPQYIFERQNPAPMNYTLCLNFQYLGEKY